MLSRRRKEMTALPTRGKSRWASSEAHADFTTENDMKRMIGIVLALVVGCASAQDSAPGTLSGVPKLDFTYLQDLSAPANALQQGQTLKLQSRFVWDGASNTPVTVDQHAVVAFTQRGATNSAQNNAGDVLWTHGAGAILGPFGLGLELWFRTDSTGNGYNDDPANAIVWTQNNGRCAADVLGTIPPGVMCLSATPSAGYITPSPSFTLRTAVAYWLRVSITPGANGWATLYADVIEEQNPTVPVQSASVGFQYAQFFPVAGQQLSASLARIAVQTYQPNVHYIAFDYGF
jgi:hypothetical protein